MDFGALHCKPQNPLCETCPLHDSCVALEKQSIKQLPVKEKKIKIKKRYFNYLVVITPQNQTIISERKGKGIWQGLYEFPLIETAQSTSQLALKSNPNLEKLGIAIEEIILFNESEIVHKLSHQHLYTQFWIVKAPRTKAKTIEWDEIEKYPVPILIANFLKNFNPSNGYF